MLVLVMLVTERNGSYVVEQLRCLGVLRTCEVLKVGMPTRVSYADLKKASSQSVANHVFFFLSPHFVRDIYVCVFFFLLRLHCWLCFFLFFYEASQNR